MQTVSIRNSLHSLHEMSNPVFWENKKNITNLSSAEIAQSENGKGQQKKKKGHFAETKQLKTGDPLNG